MWGGDIVCWLVVDKGQGGGGEGEERQTLQKRGEDELMKKGTVLTMR